MEILLAFFPVVLFVLGLTTFIYLVGFWSGSVATSPPSWIRNQLRLKQLHAGKVIGDEVVFILDKTAYQFVANSRDENARLQIHATMFAGRYPYSEIIRLGIVSDSNTPSIAALKEIAKAEFVRCTVAPVHAPAYKAQKVMDALGV